MMDLLIWGTIIIISTAITAIGIVLGIYFMITKDKLKGDKKGKYKLEDQKEIN